MSGTQADFVGRLKAVQPGGWYPPESATSGVLSPVLTALLNGPAWSLSWLYSLIGYAQDQTRIHTATDVWLDIIAKDYFGGMVQRRTNETDQVFAARIMADLFAPRATRAAMIAVLTALTGNVPTIFEPANTGDTGGYGGADALVWTNLAYNYAGGYGSLQLPFQAFITIQRPVSQGIGNIGGYYYGTGWAGGGYGAGAIEYVDDRIESEQVPDSAIFAAIAATAPAGTIMWVQLTDPSGEPVTVQPDIIGISLSSTTFESGE